MSPLLPDIALAECAAVGIAIYAPIDDGDDFSFLYLNPAGARIAGCDKQAPIGTRLSQSFPGAADIGLTEALRRVHHSGEPETLQTAWYRDGANAYWVENQVSRLPTGALMALFQDRTEQVATERADTLVKNRYYRVFDNSLVGIFTVSSQRLIMDINTRACEIFGFDDADAAIGRCIECVHISHETYLAFGEQVFSRIDSGGISNVRYRLKRQDGTPFWADLSGKPVNGSNRGDGVVWVIADVTDAVEAQAALKESEERFALAVVGVNDGLWDWNILNNSVYLSPRWKAILGYRDDEFPNDLNAWRQRIHADDIDSVLAAMNAHLLGDSDFFQHEHRMRRKDGGWGWLLARGRCTRDADGKPLRMVGSLTDINARKRAEQRSEADRARLQTMIETVQTGITIIDLTTKRVIEANSRAARILGIKREQLIGEPCSKWLCTDADACPSQHQRLPIVDRESKVRHEDGHLITVLQSIVPLRIDERDLLLESYVDISAQKRTQEQLRAATEKAEAAALAKSHFLAKMSHEIRTPMNSIIGMTQLTLETDLSAEQRENLDIVDSSAEALLGLIDDILDFTKIEAGQLDLEQIDFSLPDLMEEVLDGLSLKASSKGIELAQLIGDGVQERYRGDPMRLRQILINLLGNALKFTETGEVVVEVERDAQTSREAADTEHHRLLFRVIDTGIGVAPAQRERIFQAFQQADNSNSRQYGGTGLGLGICRQLVQLMGGEIGLRSNPGGGSVFWFSITLAQPLKAAPAEPPSSQDLTSARYLIVDDTKTNRQLLTKILTGWQCRSTAVASGAEAVVECQRAAAAGDPFDLVFLDMMMPSMDGEQTARAINDCDHCGQPALVVLTSIDHRGDAKRLAALGVAGYLLKPLKRAVLRNLLDAVLADRSRPEPVGREATTRGVKPYPSAAGALATSVDADLAGLRVLLVEDKPFNQRVAQGFLKRRGVDVSIAGDGAQAVAMFTEGDYDAVLMDVQMPVMDGYQATRHLRQQQAQQQRNPRAPIIAMTAHAMSGDRDRCLAAGMDDYLTKPIDPHQLYTTLARLTGVAPTALVTNATDPPALEADPDLQPDTEDPLARLRSLFQDDTETIRDAVEIFLEDAASTLDAINQAYSEHDRDTLAETAHAMKGMIRNFGLERIGQQAAALEQHALANNHEQAGAALRQLSCALGAMTPRLRERLDTLNA